MRYEDRNNDIDPNVTVPPPPPESLSTVSADLLAVITGYPGPAVLVSGTDEVLALNTAAQVLLNEDRGWWNGISIWRTAALAGLASQRSSRLPRGSGTLVYEWQAVRLSESLLLVLGREVTLERRLRHTLTESRQRYKDLVEISSDFAWETGPDGRFVFVSTRGALGFAGEALVGRHPRELAFEEDTDMVLTFEAQRPIDDVELWLRAADGTPTCLQTSVKPLFGAGGVRIGARGVCRDLTEQALHAAELEKVRNRERMLNHIVYCLREQLDVGKALEAAAGETAVALGANGCAIYRLEAEGTIVLAAASGEVPAELSPSLLLEEVAGASTALERQAGSLSLLVCSTRFRSGVNGSVCVWRQIGSDTWDDDARALIASVADRVGLTHAQIAYQEHLRHLSERDSLTGLFNRRTFLERLEEMLTWRDFGPSALLYIDLDNFKAVNDQRGHRQGDEVLRAVAALIMRGSRPGDIAGRMGGDEFVLWLARTEQNGATVVAERLLSGIAELSALSAGEDRPLGMSIGIALHHPGQGEGIATLLERADSAMYRAKIEGKGRFGLAARLSSDNHGLKDAAS
ncbi:MAG: sensor domain-containing diguanylate cyclase [Rhodospirillaceae bacterium]